MLRLATAGRRRREPPCHRSRDSAETKHPRHRPRHRFDRPEGGGTSVLVAAFFAGLKSPDSGCFLARLTRELVPVEGMHFICQLNQVLVNCVECTAPKRQGHSRAL